MITVYSPLTWGIYAEPPADIPKCGFVGELCPPSVRGKLAFCRWRIARAIDHFCPTIGLNEIVLLCFSCIKFAIYAVIVIDINSYYMNDNDNVCVDNTTTIVVSSVTGAVALIAVIFIFQFIR